MAPVAIKTKYVILMFVILSILIIAGKHIYKEQYLNSYREIELREIAQCSDVFLASDYPHWASLTTPETIKNIETKYGVTLNNIDLQSHMIIVSYGAELKSIDYNVQESTFKDRGYYIGFPHYGTLEPNTIFLYEAESIPIFDTDVAGFSDDYKGKYR